MSPTLDACKKCGILFDPEQYQECPTCYPTKFTISLTSFEVGVLTSVIHLSDKKDSLTPVFNQLKELHKKFRELAGVVVTELGNDMIQMRDKGGTEIIRKKYDWEKED